MGLHTETELYSGCFSLISVVGDAIFNMRRDAKRLYGDRIFDACIAIDLHLRDANMASAASRDKEPHLQLLLMNLEVVELLSRVCRDRQYLPIGHYTKVIEHTQSIGRQTNGWRKSGTGSSQQRQLQDRQGDHDRTLF